MTEYTVHFQKGSRVGARSLRMVHVEADDVQGALRLACPEKPQGYRLVRIDHFDDETRRLVID